MNIQSLQTILTNYLQERFASSVEISNLTLLSGGASLENFALDLFVHQGELQGNHELVLRTDKGSALEGSLSRLQEFNVMQVAFENKVKTAEPLWAESDSAIIGHPFYFMRREKGRADPRFVVKVPAKAKENIVLQLGQVIAAVHNIHPQTNAALDFLPLPNNTSDPYFPARSSISDIRRLAGELPDNYPALELCLNWLEKNMPATDSLVLVHGDFRTGNFLIDGQEVTALLDWEFAHYGDRHQDLAWVSMRDWRFGKIKQPIGGLSERFSFYKAYEQAGGISVDPFKVFYWEVMGNARWAVGAHQQAERHLSGQDKGIEFAAIGRRACEMEYEAMRLIEKGGY